MEPPPLRRMFSAWRARRPATCFGRREGLPSSEQSLWFFRFRQSRMRMLRWLTGLSRTAFPRFFDTNGTGEGVTCIGTDSELGTALAGSRFCGIAEAKQMEGVAEMQAIAAGTAAGELRAKCSETISLRRMVNPQAVADMVVFLSSPAGRTVSGQSLDVCGKAGALATATGQRRSPRAAGKGESVGDR